MRILWQGEKDVCPYCRSNLDEVGVWTDEPLRQSLSPGQVYLIFSGNDDLPYAFAKIICLDGDNLTVKLFRDFYAERPQLFEPERMLQGSELFSIPVDVLLAWGPPEFPLLVAQEEVSEEELNPHKRLA